MRPGALAQDPHGPQAPDGNHGRQEGRTGGSTRAHTPAEPSGTPTRPTPPQPTRRSLRCLPRGWEPRAMAACVKPRGQRAEAAHCCCDCPPAATSLPRGPAPGRETWGRLGGSQLSQSAPLSVPRRFPSSEEGGGHTPRPTHSSTPTASPQPLKPAPQAPRARSARPGSQLHAEPENPAWHSTQGLPETQGTPGTPSSFPALDRAWPPPSQASHPGSEPHTLNESKWPKPSAL